MDVQQDEELVDGNSNNKNWKGIAISLLVISIVLLCIVIAVVIKRPGKAVNLEQKAFSLDDILVKNFDPKRFHGVWINDYSFTYQNDNLNIILFDCRTQTEQVVISNHTLKQLVGDKFKYTMTSDPSVFLFSYDIKPIYRHSGLSRYKIFNTISNTSYDVLPLKLYQTDQIQNALLSPNGRNLAFVYKNNIFLMTKFFDGISDSNQITFDGYENTIYNGIADWLYEEEILSQSNAMWWSSTSDKLAFIKFNDTLVKFYSFSTYDGTQYDHMNNLRYPKPDTPNPLASLFVYHVKDGRTVKLNVPDSLVQLFKEYYIWSVKWLTDDSIIVVYVNRKQSRSITIINDATTGNVLLSKEYPSAPMNNYEGWFLPTGLLASSRYNFYFQIWPYEGYKSIISFDTRNGEAFPIATHQFDVTDMLHFNEKSGFIYYLATNGDPKQRHLFKKKVTDQLSKSECLTCSNITIPYENPSQHTVPLGSSENCLYYTASFSTNGDFYVLECLGDKIPISYIKRSDNSSYEYVLEDNKDLRQLLESRILVKKSYLRVYLDNSTNAYSDAELIYPPNFEPSETMYPVLVYTYNGPTSQTVDFQFRIRKFETFVAVNFGVIVAVMDGRGTDSNGDKFMKSVAKNLGDLEMQDQLALASALRKETYTDDDKFAIWGWSYGGYLSSMTLFHENSPFRCAVSGAPVVDWLQYDSAYTERLMGLYNENRVGYEKSNLTQFARQNSKSFLRKRILLIHGTGDDNVHFQHSALLAKYLRTTKIDLEFEVYPDMQHTPDEETQVNLYQKITKFLLNCYNLNYQQFYDQLNYQHLIGDVTSLNSKASEEGDKE